MALHSALTRPAQQQPAWADRQGMDAVRATLGSAPPISRPTEIDRLASALADVAAGRALVLQAGDCAETFVGNTQGHIRRNLELLVQVSKIVAEGSKLPVVTVGRIAGQYAKPRSAEIDPQGLPVYRGDMVNSPVPTRRDRIHHPERMLRAYQNASSTMNAVRQINNSHPRETVTETVPEIFVSHEALVLDYERALTRQVRRVKGTQLYDLSAHFLWIGERTRQLDGAHVAFAELLTNPIGVKLGPTTSPETAVQYVERLDPHNIPGHLTLICRMGFERLPDVLPTMVKAVAATGHQVIWQCDPMHGNTRLAANGYKTRHFDHILAEIHGYFEVHKSLGTHPGGLHLELTGDEVAECLGGPADFDLHDLVGHYESVCDPRLNVAQSIDLGRHVAALFRDCQGHD